MEVAVLTANSGAAVIGVCYEICYVKGCPCVKACINTGFGERGRNRTYNLLIFDQQPTNQWFQRFPKRFRRQK